MVHGHTVIFQGKSLSVTPVILNSEVKQIMPLLELLFGPFSSWILALPKDPILVLLICHRTATNWEAVPKQAEQAMFAVFLFPLPLCSCVEVCNYWKCREAFFFNCEWSGGSHNVIGSVLRVSESTCVVTFINMTHFVNEQIGHVCPEPWPLESFAVLKPLNRRCPIIQGNCWTCYLGIFIWSIYCRVHHVIRDFAVWWSFIWWHSKIRS